VLYERLVLFCCPTHFSPALATIMTINWITAIFSIFTAIIAVLIAYGQYRNASYRIKMDLFDKRFEFYDKLRNILITSISGIDKNNMFDVFQEIGECKRLAVFLFDDEFAKEISNIDNRVIELTRIYARLHEEGSLPVGEARNEAVDQQMELLNEFIELKDTLETKFSRFMKLNK